MIPEVAVAMLACARIGAIHNVVFGGFSPGSVKERMEFSEAKALITVDGGRRKGKVGPVKPEVDKHFADLDGLQKIVVVRHTGNDAEMEAGQDVWSSTPSAADDDPASRWTPTRRCSPLRVGLDHQAEGHRHTTGEYLAHVAYAPAVFDLKADSTCMVLGRRRLGHRALVHGLRAARERHHLGHLEGRARLPAQGGLVGALPEAQRHEFLHRPHRDPGLHEVGRGARREADLLR